MTEQYPVLYSFRRCPYAMRARLALILCGIQAEVREVNLKDKPQAMLDLSPKGTVPVLHLPNGQVIDESIDIVDWAVCNALVKNNLMLKSQEECEIGRASAALLERFIPLVYRYKYPERYPDVVSAEVVDESKAILKTLDLELQKNRYISLSLERFCQVDILWLPLLRQFWRADPEAFGQFGVTNLLTWLNKWEQSKVFSMLMLKRPFWSQQNGSAENQLLICSI